MPSKKKRIAPRLTSAVRKLGYKSYAEYLTSPHWKAVREEALDFYGRECETCGTDSFLQVHHRHYKNLGCEQVEDLQVLCRSCHKKRHSRKGGRKRSNQNPCPPGVPEHIWYDVTARYQEFAKPVLTLLAAQGPMTTKAITSELAPDLNTGRMGEVLKILHRDKRVKKVSNKSWMVVSPNT